MCGRQGRVLFLLYLTREKLNKEMEILRKKLSFMYTKRFDTFFEMWVKSHVDQAQLASL